MKRIFMLLLASMAFSNLLIAQEEEKKKTMEIYGFIMMDAGYNFDQIHPDWFDVVRPTKLTNLQESVSAQMVTFSSVRQTDLGFKNYFQTVWAN